MKTIKFYIIAFLLLLKFTNGISQVLTPKWESCFGGTEWDEATGIILVDSTYFVVAQTKSNDGDISYNHGTYDIWFLNVDANGNLISEKTFGGSYADALFIDIKAKNDSVFYIAAWSQSEDGDISNNPWPNASGNLWILQVNKQGNILWETMAGGSKTDELRDATVTNDGGILLLAFTDSYDGDVTGYHGGYDLWLIKIDSTGQKQWNKCFGGNGLEDGGSVIQTSDGGYMIIGDTDGRGGGNYDTTCNFHNPGSFYSDTWIVKLDSDGNIEWQQCYGGSYHDYANNAIELSDGYIILAGTMSNDGDVSGYHGIPGPGDNGDDIWVFKIDKSGNLLWQKCLGGTYIEWARNIFPTSDGGFMIVGSTGSNDGDVVGNHNYGTGYGIHDVWFAKIDSIGNLLWQYCYGGRDDEMMYRGVIQKSDWDYVLAIGTTTYNWRCYSNGNPWPDVRVAELYDSTVGVTEHNANISGVKLYPNPANNRVTFIYTLPVNIQKAMLSLYTANGKTVYRTQLNTGSSSLQYNCEHLKAGIYYYTVATDAKTLSGKLVIVR